MRDVVAGFFMLTVSILFWMGASSIQISRLSGGAGAQAMPKALALALGIFSIILIIKHGSPLLTRRGKHDTSDEKTKEETLRKGRRALGMLLIGITYIIVIEYLGYAFSVGLLLAATSYFMGWRKWPSLVAFSVLGGLVFWCFFDVILGLPLPVGVLFT